MELLKMHMMTISACPSRMLGHYAQDLSSNQVEVFGPAYLRVSNEEDKTGILEQNRTEMIS
jgi:hypothetical protein